MRVVGNVVEIVLLQRRIGKPKVLRFTKSVGVENVVRISCCEEELVNQRCDVSYLNCRSYRFELSFQILIPNLPYKVGMSSTDT